MKYTLYIIILGCILLGIMACGLTAPLDFGHAEQFTLNAIDSPKKTPIKQLGNLAVEFPQVDSELNTYRVALLRADGKRDYYAGTRWADFLPAIVQSTLVQTLENSGNFTLVSADYTNTNIDYLLQSDIQVFHADYTDTTPPTIIVTMRFTLTDARTQKIITTQRITQKVEAKRDSLTSIYHAFTDAFLLVQEAMLENTIRTTRHK